MRFNADPGKTPLLFRGQFSLCHSMLTQRRQARQGGDCPSSLGGLRGLCGRSARRRHTPGDKMTAPAFLHAGTTSQEAYAGVLCAQSPGQLPFRAANVPARVRHSTTRTERALRPTTQAQRPGARDATIANRDAMPGSLQRMVRPRHSVTPALFNTCCCAFVSGLVQLRRNAS